MVMRSKANLPDLGAEAKADVKLGVYHPASLQKLSRRAKLTLPLTA
jgi:hypothetical protein